ncbi:MAG: RNA polymerase sigma factor, partial [Candidatus Spyradenecus sp.]
KVASFPKTSATLLADLARDSQHARWGEFVTRYRPMMEAYLHARFPQVDADEAIQETLIALIRRFPIYRYVPEERGAFHTYLTGILRHKALKWLRVEQRHRELQVAPEAPSRADEAAKRQEAIFEIALQQLLADETLQQRTREIFARVAVNGEKPAAVAEAFGIERNAVDQVKQRLMARLRELVRHLEAVEDESHA